MLSSIHPLGERGRQSRWVVTATVYAAGSAAGGAAAGLAAGAVGSAVSPGTATVAVLVLAVGLAGAAFDLGWARLPSLERQVDENWLNHYRGWVYGAGYGFQLGLGLATIVTSATVYATFALAFLTGSPTAGLVIGLAFGATRGAAIFTMRRASTPGLLRAAHRRMANLAPVARRTAVATQLGVVAVATALIVM